MNVQYLWCCGFRAKSNQLFYYLDLLSSTRLFYLDEFHQVQQVIPTFVMGYLAKSVEFFGTHTNQV
ncbi:hypothetical protein [Aetokthonos hydrillicola]|uniref:hypothetical protein n=1 Tax=Aetokthonos hydrillicola TaxID=1550245 RepID=UPI001ABA63C9|nr:hypothetical protein [Aetokthonos hydrillicola]